MKITYFGHSALQVQTKTLTFLFDPFITGNPLAEGIVTAAELNPDVVLMTHAHGDHWGDAEEIIPRTGALLISNYEICTYLERKTGYNRYHPMNTGGSASFEWGHVKQTYARHSSSFPDGTYGGNPNGFVLETEGKTLYHAGDTDLFNEMAYLGEDFEIDIAFLPIGDNFTMGIRDAIRAAKMLRAKNVIPVHHNTFPYIVTDLLAWQSAMKDAGQKGIILKPGETFVLE